MENKAYFNLSFYLDPSINSEDFYFEMEHFTKKCQGLFFKSSNMIVCSGETNDIDGLDNLIEDGQKKCTNSFIGVVDNYQCDIMSFIRKHARVAAPKDMAI